MTDKLNIIFFSSSDFVLPILKDIKDNEGAIFSKVLEDQLKYINNFDYIPAIEDIIKKQITNTKFNKPIKLKLIVTQPDRKNRQKIISNPIAMYARENSIELYTPEKIKTEIEDFKKISINADIGITASFGQILPQTVLNIPKYGIINWHPSRLPKYRGATPMQTAIANGDEKTALSWIEMTKGMDAGNILLQMESSIEKKTDIFEMAKQMGQVGKNTWAVAVAIQILRDSNSEEDFSIKQNKENVTLCKMLEKKDSLIDANEMNAKQVYNHWKAYKMFPKTEVEDSKFGRIKLRKLNGWININEINELRIENGKEEVDNNNWLQIKDKKKIRTFLKCHDNTFVEVEEIGLNGGKILKLSGIEINKTTN